MGSGPNSTPSSKRENGTTGTRQNIGLKKETRYLTKKKRQNIGLKKETKYLTKKREVDKSVRYMTKWKSEGPASPKNQCGKQQLPRQHVRYLLLAPRIGRSRRIRPNLSGKTICP